MKRYLSDVKGYISSFGGPTYQLYNYYVFALTFWSKFIVTLYIYLLTSWKLEKKSRRYFFLWEESFPENKYFQGVKIVSIYIFAYKKTTVPIVQLTQTEPNTWCLMILYLCFVLYIFSFHYFYFYINVFSISIIITFCLVFWEISFIRWQNMSSWIVTDTQFNPLETGEFDD